MRQSQYEESIKKLYNLFTEIYLTFHTWKGLQDEAYNSIFERNPNFWNAVLFSLERSWLTGLANIYEESQYSKRGEVISVYALALLHKDALVKEAVTGLLQNHAKAIKTIQILRQNRFAHNNVDHLLNPTKILREFPITYREVEELLSISNQLLSFLNPRVGHHYSFENFSEGCRQDSRSVVEIIKSFFEMSKILTSSTTRSQIGHD